MDTDLQPIAEQPRLTRKVNAIAGVCISVYLRLSVVSSFELPFLGSAVVSTAFFRFTAQIQPCWRPWRTAASRLRTWSFS